MNNNSRRVAPLDDYDARNEPSQKQYFWKVFGYLYRAYFFFKIVENVKVQVPSCVYKGFRIGSLKSDVFSKLLKLNVYISPGRKFCGSIIEL